MTRIVPHRGRRVQRGHGVGGVFRALGRHVVPWITKLVTSPSAKRIGKSIGREAVRAGAGVLSDTLAGENVSRALDKQLKVTKKKVRNQLKRVEASGDLGSLVPPKKTKRKPRGRGTPLF